MRFEYLKGVGNQPNLAVVSFEEENYDAIMKTLERLGLDTEDVRCNTVWLEVKDKQQFIKMRALITEMANSLQPI